MAGGPKPVQEVGCPTGPPRQRIDPACIGFALLAACATQSRAETGSSATLLACQAAETAALAEADSQERCGRARDELRPACDATMAAWAAAADAAEACEGEPETMLAECLEASQVTLRAAERAWSRLRVVLSRWSP